MGQGGADSGAVRWALPSVTKALKRNLQHQDILYPLEAPQKSRIPFLLLPYSKAQFPGLGLPDPHVPIIPLRPKSMVLSPSEELKPHSGVSFVTSLADMKLF